MDGAGKSDSCVVPKKVQNKAWRRVAEGLEGRRLAERNWSNDTSVRAQYRALRTQSRAKLVRSMTGTRTSPRNGGPTSASDARQEPGAVVPHAGICGGGGQQWPSLLRSAPLRREAACHIKKRITS